MKKAKYILASIVLVSSLTFTSCSEEFLDTLPTDSVTEQTAYATADNLMVAVNGMHRNMYVRQNSSQGQNGYTAQMIYADVLGDDVIFPSQGNGWFVRMMRWLVNNNEASSDLSYPWNFWSGMIKNANYIINYGPNASGDTDLRDKAIGEAYAYRAFSQFQLVQLYGDRYVNGRTNDQLGIVIRTEASDNEPKARATVEETYAQIWADLDKAEQLLAGKTKTNSSHFALDNVLGIKARVALVQQKYNEAAQYAALARTGKSLMTQEQYKEGFNDYANPEWMWGVTILGDQSDFFGNFHAYMSRNYNSTQIRQAPKVVNLKLYNAFPDSDVRKQLIDPTGQHESLNLASTYAKFPYTSEKFVTKNRDNNTALGDVPFMRVAEMYLIEAEAKYFLGDEAGSKAVLTELATARDAAFTGFTTSGQAYLEELYLQRRIELWGEGFRFFDLKRTNSPLNRRDTGAVGTIINNVWEVPANDKKWTWVIPRQELNSNPLVIQNPS
ncbi:RagB/SusD family nutrient uptake outer membrane protein [Faecalibacter sp. LW9]|uniref:RagB/SusD family nutrient uptake outer membrane protein n=1 Tax=Faecalibacter sp. LW9 TaxID=3103144 RepID=UPI002AFDEDE5|nr:RagB/SusD family nutrient uptake outer membrane protein [Faecalibacter sp. LW9]